MNAWRRTVVAAFAALATVTTAPYLAAWWRPPDGHAFTGVFFYRDDFYQYLSFAEQAGHGALAFRNKFDLRPHEPFVVNVEWWTAGVLGRLAGGPAAGFHALRLVALLGLVSGAAALLRRAGLSGAPLRWALALVVTGGGLGWLALWAGTPGWQVPDVAMGLYPFHQSLTNTHFAVGTALLLWSLALLLDARAARGPRWRWIATATLLGFSRPYDFATFAATAGLLGLVDLARARTRRSGVGGLLDLAWLAPVAVYYGLLAGAHPSFGGWGGQDIDLSPPLHHYVLALLPAALLWIVFAGRRGASAPAGVREALYAWGVANASLLLLGPSGLARQTVTGLGAAMLLLAATAVPRRALPWAVFALAPTSAFLLWRVFHPWPDCFAPRDYFAAVERLRGACAPGDVAIAPTDLSLMVAGLTPCSVVFGHRTLTPGYAERLAEGNRFYHEPDTPAGWRRAYAEARGARFVAVPAQGGERLLGPASPFRPILRTPLLEVWERR